jgi:hypothetical protein
VNIRNSPKFVGEKGIMKEIKLTQNMVAMVDDEDFDYLNQFRWHTIKGPRNVFYARRCVKPRLMHRIILKAHNGVIVDHKDRNGLNNKKSNLRLCTELQNNRNSIMHTDNKSGFKGVCFDYNHRGSKQWVAQICINRKIKKIGYYSTKEAAAYAYDEAAKLYFGEFARTNFNSLISSEIAIQQPQDAKARLSTQPNRN